ncbi:MAG TPA: lysylphosphatidylglycerol synthase transmembrane domain-containing protein [Gaiellaceae bacterium]
MRSLRRWIGPAVSLAILAIVVWRLGTGPFVDGVKGIDAGALLAAAGIFFLTTVCAAWRWAIVSRGLGARLSFPKAVAAYYRAVFLNLLLPAGIAGDVHRGVTHGREVEDVGRGLRAVWWERAAGQVVQVVLAVAVLLVLPSPVRSSMPFVAAGLVVGVLAIVVLGRMRRGGGSSRWARVRSTAASDVRNGVLRRNTLPAVLLASVLVFVGHAATFVVAARTTGVDAPLSRLVPLAVLALLAVVLPSIAGWGPREGATAWVFAAAGLGADKGAATAVAYGVLVLAASLPGAIVLLVGWLPRRGRASTRSRRRFVFGPEGAADA